MGGFAFTIPQRFLLASTLLLASISPTLSAETDNRIAVGKTDLSAKNCTEKAKKSLSAIGVENITTSHDLQNFKKPEKTDDETPASVFGRKNGISYIVSCRPFKEGLVVFSVAGENAADIIPLWDQFYK